MQNVARALCLALLWALSTVQTQAQNARVVAATSANGRSITIYATGSEKPVVSLAQINEMASIFFDEHKIEVFENGNIQVDDIPRSFNDFRSLEIYIGDNDSIDLKVVR